MDKFTERDLDNLAAILDYCDRISDTVNRFGKDFEIFRNDNDYRDSVLMNILQIGEASNRLSDKCKEQMGEIPWHQMYGIRNIIVHGYIQIKDELIWDVVTNDAENLKNKIEKYTEGILF